MSYIPAIPLNGYAGWAYLKRTMAAQTKAFNNAPEVKSDETYFRDKIGKITTAAQLVADRRLLKLALAAFGLEKDLDNKFFIQKVLQDGTLKTGTLANKLADKQYQKLSKAFGFGDYAVPSTQISTFADEIISAYKARRFETAVGDQSEDLRLALNLQRELPLLAAKTSSSDNTKWFTILGNTPLRTVFEKALGLPSSIGVLDLDQQLGAFKAKAKAQLGTDAVADFADPTKLEGLVRRFLVRSEAQTYAKSGSGNAALLLMSQISSNARARYI
ncbi:MAG: Flagellar protein [Cypionkella sp.]|uniref:DUF1217 domain-containing protein n=1 Tax=Cypionkella sp. TaxID=2811411 RepID=UPI002636B344|nr:DUF1217 domain-containing protein [Cypionkella sp.]MDB5659320.1 Flagellar protein [Cypionkella sp.]